MRKSPLCLAAPETRVAEWVNLAAFAWWSLLLLLPTAHLFAVTPGFSALAARADERHWGAFTAAAALLCLAGLVSRRPAWRVLGLAAAAALWAFVSAQIAVGAPALPLLGILLPRSTGVGVYATLGIASFCCGLLLSVYFVADLQTVWALATGRAGRERPRQSATGPQTR
jgi:hypothetical protein